MKINHATDYDYTWHNNLIINFFVTNNAGDLSYRLYLCLWSKFSGVAKHVVKGHLHMLGWLWYVCVHVCVWSRHSCNRSTKLEDTWVRVRQSLCIKNRQSIYREKWTEIIIRKDIRKNKESAKNQGCHSQKTIQGLTHTYTHNSQLSHCYTVELTNMLTMKPVSSPTLAVIAAHTIINGKRDEFNGKILYPEQDMIQNFCWGGIFWPN